MRLFAAIDPPAEAVADLARSVRRKGTGLTWVPPSNWHVTTAFFGEVDAVTLEGLCVGLERCASRTKPMTLQLSGAGCFPRRPNAARVLWAGLGGDREELSALAARCVAAGRRTGLELERRKYAAHVTLARARTPTDLSGRLAELWTYAGPVWTGSTLRLVRSTLGSEVRHETLAEWALGA